MLPVSLLLLLFLNLGKDIFPKLLLLVFSLLPDFFFILNLSFLSFFSLFLSRLWHDSHRLSNLPRILDNLVSIRLLKPEIILRLELIHLHTPFLILLINFLKLLSFQPINMLTQPLPVHYIVTQEHICLIHILLIPPYLFNQLLCF